jgi:hypothetical protein
VDQRDGGSVPFIRLGRAVRLVNPGELVGGANEIPKWGGGSPTESDWWLEQHEV